MIAKDVLLIDNDFEFTQLLREFLAGDGLTVDVYCDDQPACVGAALSGRYAIAVIDVSLPQARGFTVLRDIRQHSRMAVLLLGALSDPLDRARALQLGADECLTKPCPPKELSTCLKTMRRRMRDAEMGVGTASVQFLGALAIWGNHQRAEWNGKPLELTSTEFQLLGTLANAGARPVSKQELSIRALGRPYAAYDRNIDVQMNNISSKLNAATNGQAYIQPVYRQGYQLVRG